MRKVTESKGPKNYSGFLLLFALVKYLVLITTFSLNLQIGSYVMFSFLLAMLTIIQLYNSKERYVVKIASLNFMKSLTFSLRWGRIYEDALCRANLEIAHLKIEITKDTLPDNVEVDKLDLGSLRSTLTHIMTRGASERKAFARYARTNKLIHDSFTNLSEFQRGLKEFSKVSITSSCYLIALALLALLNPLFKAEVLTDSNMTIVLALFLLSEFISYGLLSTYRKEQL